MKPLFNLDPKFNGGFKIDMSQLTEKQRNHVLQMFEVRGIKWMGGENASERTDTLWGGYDALIFRNDTLAQGQGKFEDLPIITYPELCRGAVQLEPNEYATGDTLKIGELFKYAKHLGLCRYVKYVRGENAIYFTPHKTIYTTLNVNKGSLTIEDFEAKLRGISPVIRENRTTESADNAQCTEPQVEQPLIEDCGNKTLKDNPTIADHIGSHFNLAFQYAVKLEQENAQLENLLKVSKDLNNDYKEANEKLKAELATLKEQFGKTEQLPVYDANWLDKIVMDYADKKYALFGESHIVAVACLGSWAELDPKTSAEIIIRAVAKELNGCKQGNQAIWYDTEMERYDVWEKETVASYGNILFVDAQKAIDILNQHFPQVLKNYFE